jgi:hypothetical protein
LFATSLHLLFNTSQNKPVDESQSLMPQAQLPEFTEVPLVTEHMILELQVLVEAKQNNVDKSQSMVPHVQLSELPAEPSSMEHGPAVTVPTIIVKSSNIILFMQLYYI